MTNQLEKAFIVKIDCKFPYHDKNACLQLIDEAAALSSNSIFFVIEQLCRVPFSDRNRITTELLLDLLSLTKSKFTHPLKEMVVDTAMNMIQKQELTVDEAISRMNIIKDYKGQFAALCVVYFCCGDKEDRIENICDTIISNWNAHSV